MTAKTDSSKTNLLTCGIWIDRRKAIVVTHGQSNDDVQVVESGVEQKLDDWSEPRPSKAYGSKHISTEDTREKKLHQYLDVLFDKVISIVKEADKIWITGPGQVKGEFHKRLASENLQERVVGIETADSMTQAQFVAQVKQFFDKH